MKEVQFKTVLIIALTSHAASIEVWADSVGVVDSALALATSGDVLAEVGTNPEQEVSLELQGQSWMRSTTRQELRQRRAVGVTHKRYLANSEYAAHLNGQIMGDINETLTSKRQRVRFRELLLQDRIRFAHPVDTLRLLDLNPDQATFDGFVRAFADLGSDSERELKELRFESAREYLLRENIFNAKQFSGVVGDSFLAVYLPTPLHKGVFEGMYFYPHMLDIAMKPKTHVRLELSARQGEELTKVATTLSKRFDRVAFKAALADKEKTLEEKEALFNSWMTTVEKEIADALDSSEKAGYLRQLVIQNHLSAFQFNWAMRSAGSDRWQEFGKVNTNKLYAVTTLRHEAIRLQKGIQELKRLFPGSHAKIDRAVGKPWLPGSIYESEDREFYNTSRLEILKQVFGKGKSKSNPRRG